MFTISEYAPPFKLFCHFTIDPTLPESVIVPVEDAKQMGLVPPDNVPAIVVGLTVTVWVSVDPLQVTALFVKVGVTTYVAVLEVVPLFVNVWFMELPVELLAPVVVVLFVPVHVQPFVPPVVVLVNVIPEPVPEQIVGLDGLADTTGVGFTVTVRVRVAPVQLTLLLVKVGVITYVAVLGVVPELPKIWFIGLPLELDAPVVVVLFVPVQAQVLVPPVVLFVNTILGPVVAQIVGFTGVADTVGAGLTVTVCVSVEPEHVTLLLANVGVIT